MPGTLTLQLARAPFDAVDRGGLIPASDLAQPARLAVGSRTLCLRGVLRAVTIPEMELGLAFGVECLALGGPPQHKPFFSGVGVLGSPG